MTTVTAAQLAATVRVGDRITLTRPAIGTVHPVPTIHTGEFVSATEVTVGPRQMIRVEIETQSDFLAYYQELDAEIVFEGVAAEVTR